MEDDLKKAKSQNVEYKRGWHDEYLKWICGFVKLSNVRYVRHVYRGHWEVDCRSWL